MWKTALAGALALATMGSSFALAESGADRGMMQSQTVRVSAPEENGVFGSQIAYFKSALRLTSEQERHWPRVEAVLRDIVQHHQYADAANSRGVVQRISDRASAIMLSASAVKRLVSAARPLVKSLDDDQKRIALALAREIGFGSVAAQLE